MIYANDEVFNIRYNAELDKLQIKKKNKFLKFIVENKFITTIGVLFVLFSCINCILIYNFMEVFKSI